MILSFDSGTQVFWLELHEYGSAVKWGSVAVSLDLLVLFKPFPNSNVFCHKHVFWCLSYWKCIIYDIQWM